MILSSESRTWIGRDFSARSDNHTLVMWRLKNVCSQYIQILISQHHNEKNLTVSKNPDIYRTAWFSNNGWKIYYVNLKSLYACVFLWIKGHMQVLVKKNLLLCNTTVRGLEVSHSYRVFPAHYYGNTLLYIIYINIWQLNVDLHLAQSISNSIT